MNKTKEPYIGLIGNDTDGYLRVNLPKGVYVQENGPVRSFRMMLYAEKPISFSNPIRFDIASVSTHHFCPICGCAIVSNTQEYCPSCAKAVADDTDEEDSDD